MTRPTGAVSALSQSYWSPRLYQHRPRTGRPLRRMPPRRVAKAESQASCDATGSPRFEVSATQKSTP